MTQAPRLKLGPIPAALVRAMHGAARLFLLAAFSSLAACGGSGPSGPSVPPGGPGPGPGVPEGGVPWGFFAYTSDLVSGLVGVRQARFTGILWADVERPPGSGNYDWNELDGRIRLVQNAGLNVILVLKTGNGQAFSDPGCYLAVEAGDFPSGKQLSSCPIKPEMEGAWSRMVGELVERYDGDGNRDMPGRPGNVRLDIQVENEAANRQFWAYDERNRTVAADRYLRLLELSYQAKQMANPATQVILTGLFSPNLLARCDANPGSPGCNSFVLQSLAFSKRILTRPQIFDAVDVHFFVYYHFEPGFIDDSLRWVAGQMQQGGYQRPVYALELTGSCMLPIAEEHAQDFFFNYFPYRGDFPSLEAFTAMYAALDQPGHVIYRQWFEAEQAKELGKVFSNLLAGGVRRLVHIQYTDYHPRSAWNSVWWNWQGVIKYVGGPVRKPSYYTFNILSERLAGFTSARRIGQGDDVRLYEFTFANRGPTYVLWTDGPAVVLNLSSIVPGSTLRSTHMVTSLDRNNQAVVKPDETVPVTAVPAGDVPILLTGVG